MKREIRHIWQIIVVYMIIIAIGGGVYIADIVVASKIPQKAIMDNVNDAYIRISNEGLYPSVYGLNMGFYDNWSDAILCNIIVNQNSENPLFSGVANYYTIHGDGETPIDALGKAISGQGEKTAYSNFWLGSIVFLKLLLIFLNWGEIRYFLYFISALFQISIAILIYKKVNWKAMVAYLFSTTLFCLMYNVSCAAYASEILLMQCGTLFILLLYDRFKPKVLNGRYEFFFVAGMLSCFLGYPEFPMYSLGMYVVLHIMLDEEASINNLQQIKYSAVATFTWIMGYGITALSKQGVAKLILGNQIGFSKLAHWSGGGLRDRLLAFLIPLKSFNNQVLKFILLMILLGVIFLLITRKIVIRVTLISLKKGILFIVVGCIFPYVYYAILCTAVGHGFYCNDMLSAIFSISYVLLCGIHTSNKDELKSSYNCIEK